MLYLGQRHMDVAVTPGEVMSAVERAVRLHAAGAYEMPPRIHLDHQENTVLYMPCFVESVFGTKMLTLFPGNAAKQRPVIEGLMLLNDAETGVPLALFNGAKLTALRTGGVGGVGVRHTSPAQATTIGLIGAGVQGWHQLIFAAASRDLVRISVLDLDRERLSGFVRRLRQVLPQVEVTEAASPEALLLASEIVITTTNATCPVLPDDPELLRGKHFIGIGSYKPDMREYPEAVYRLIKRLLIDTEHGLHESGDLLLPLERGWIQPEQTETFGHLLTSAHADEAAQEETTLFKCVGMALLDLVVAELIYQRALERGVGQRIEY